MVKSNEDKTMTHPDRLAYAAHNASERESAKPYVPPTSENLRKISHLADQIEALRGQYERAARAHFIATDDENHDMLGAEVWLRKAGSVLDEARRYVAAVKEE